MKKQRKKIAVLGNVPREELYEILDKKKPMTGDFITGRIGPRGKEGVWETFEQQEDGSYSLTVEQNYAFNRPNGERREYYPVTGIIRLKGQRVDGVKQGYEYCYDEAGRLLSKTEWRNGEEDGETILYYRNETPEYRAILHKKNAYGLAYCYAQNGALTQKIVTSPKMPDVQVITSYKDDKPCDPVMIAQGKVQSDENIKAFYQEIGILKATEPTSVIMAEDRKRKQPISPAGWR